jgi:hypothetical protein
MLLHHGCSQPITIRNVCIILYMAFGLFSCSCFAQQVSLRETNISEQALVDFNSKVLRSVRENDSDILEDLVNWEKLDARMSDGVEGAPESIRGYLKHNRSFIKHWVSARNRDSLTGDFQYRQLRRTNDSIQAIYRLITVKGAATYHGLEIDVSADGSLCIVDFDDIGQGEKFSEYGSRILTGLLDGLGAEVPTNPTPVQRESIRNINDRLVFSRLVKDHKPLGALSVYRSLPESDQRDRHILFQRLKAAEELEPCGPEHQQAIEDIERFVPDGSSRHFITLSYYARSGDTERALASADYLLKEFGPDAWIEMQIASIHKKSGQLDVARKTIDLAVEREPNMWIAHLNRVDIATAQFDFAAAVDSLMHLDAIRPIADLSKFERGSGNELLVISTEYLQWKASRAKSQSPCQ